MNPDVSIFCLSVAKNRVSATGGEIRMNNFVLLYPQSRNKLNERK
jgi:hypothetical protein